MAGDWQSMLDRWAAASLIDSDTASRIRTWETEHSTGTHLRWPVRLALAFGAILLGAGVLLFVSAHWEDLSPFARMTLVVMLTGMFHVAGAMTAQRFESMSIALHTIGTVSLGAGIALTGQIFNLSEHWPSAILLWAAGAALAWIVLRHWTQSALTAILVPAWMAGEFFETHEQTGAIFLCLSAFCYLAAARSSDDSPHREALAWIGGICLIPTIAGAAFARNSVSHGNDTSAFAWIVAVAVPIAFSFATRRRAAWMSAVAAVWVIGLSAMGVNLWAGTGPSIGFYPWCVIGAVGLCGWGIYEKRIERVNLGTLGFAITLIAFYFAHIMDKLGRSASLIGLGILFLAGGWALERVRRKLAARIREEPA